MQVSPLAAVAYELHAGEMPACVFEGPLALAVLETFVPEAVPFGAIKGGCARTYQPPGGETQMDWPVDKGSQEATCGFQALSCAEVKLLPVEARIEVQVVLLSEISRRVQFAGDVLFGPDVLKLNANDGRTASGKPQALF